VSTASEASPPPPPPARRQGSRTLDLLTAVMLGVVSLTTALGAWQATTWTRQAADYGESSADARDANITRSIDWQGYYRIDQAVVLQARKFALLEDEATVSGDFVAGAYSNVMVANQLARSINPELPDAFAEWREAGFPSERLPTSDAGYVAELRADADSYSIVSALAGGFKEALQTKASIFTQAALVNALALFLLGVAGINRLRAARFATLALGAAAYLASLVMMASAY
jgi:hypothetical protein